MRVRRIATLCVAALSLLLVTDGTAAASVPVFTSNWSGYAMRTEKVSQHDDEIAMTFKIPIVDCAKSAAGANVGIWTGFGGFGGFGPPHGVLTQVGITVECKTQGVQVVPFWEVTGGTLPGDKQQEIQPFTNATGPFNQGDTVVALVEVSLGVSGSQSVTFELEDDVNQSFAQNVYTVAEPIGQTAECIAEAYPWPMPKVTDYPITYYGCGVAASHRLWDVVSGEGCDFTSPVVVASHEPIGAFVAPLTASKYLVPTRTVPGPCEGSFTIEPKKL